MTTGCTHNRRDLLVVDNAWTHGTSQCLKEFVSRSLTVPARQLREPALGNRNALNRGLRELPSDVLVFTDDGVWVEDRWAGVMMKPFDGPPVGVLGGWAVGQWPAATSPDALRQFV